MIKRKTGFNGVRKRVKNKNRKTNGKFYKMLLLMSETKRCLRKGLVTKGSQGIYNQKVYVMKSRIKRTVTY